MAQVKLQSETTAWPPFLAKDLLILAKPGISLMSVIVAAGSMTLAYWTTKGALVSPLDAVLCLFGVALSVSGAGALNQWMEYDLDARMSRTMDRPLPAGRMEPQSALLAGLAASALAMPLLFVLGPLPVALNFLALVLYVLVYTPMKQRSSWAVVVGAIPGAMPALLGYSAVTGRVDAVGLVLFGIVFLWQLPHFLAITVYREAEYKKAGYVVAASVLGLSPTSKLILITAIPLVGVSLLLVPLNVAGVFYGSTAVILGSWFIFLCAKGFVTDDSPQSDTSQSDTSQWARRVFFGSLIYQTVLFGALAVDVSLRALLA